MRTGDTPASARARMLRKSPHILITTPESLNIMLTTLRGRGMFSGTRAVIVDEIHAIAGTKRGAHLALTLERLEALVEDSPQRIGLSATQRPLEEVARFLGGCERVDQRDAAHSGQVTIVDCGMTKEMEISVESPVADLGNVGGSIWPAVAPLVLRHISRVEHDARLREQPRASRKDRGKGKRARGRRNRAALSRLAVRESGGLCSRSVSRPARCARS